MGRRTGAWIFLAALSASGSACSSPETLSGPGGSCLMDTDCQLGFVCYKSACTNNLTGLVNIEDAGGPYDSAVQMVVDASMPPAADGSMPPSEAGMAEAASSPPSLPEAGTTAPDATQPPAEASSPSPMPEASPPREASTPTSEASPAPDDAATPPQDASASGG
jgi:hypothetical protein